MSQLPPRKSGYRLRFYGAKRETAAERAEREKREAREWLDEQVAAGRLVIRQATPEERERYGIRDDAPGVRGDG